MTDLMDAFIARCAGEIGNYYPGKSKYGTWYDREHSTGKGIYDAGPFCAMGLTWAAAQVGVPHDVIPPHAYTPSGAAWFRKQGRWTAGVKGIRRGDLWFSSCAGIGRVSHVGVVESVNNDGSFNTIEFNTSGTYQGDQRNGRLVLRKRRNSACSLGGYGRPNYPSIAGSIRPEIQTPNQEDDMFNDADRGALAKVAAESARVTQINEALVNYILDENGRGNQADSRILGQIRSRRDEKGNLYYVADEGDVGHAHRTEAAQIGALTDVIKALALGQGADPEAIAAAAETGARRAIAASSQAAADAARG